MFIQHVLKGITGLDDVEADEMLLRSGIYSNWWRTEGSIDPAGVTARLTEDAVRRHLSGYDDIDPGTGRRFGETSPFISTSAGVVERDHVNSVNVPFPPLLTALKFATEDYSRPGHVFYAYLFVLGKKAVPLREFAEETRDLLTHTEYQPYHPEGEVVAKVHIPTQRLERWEWYDPGAARRDWRKGDIPRPTRTSATNPNYLPPERIHNIRPLLT